MIKKYRQAFNTNFTAEKYHHFVKALENGYPEIPFRVAETPIFIPEALKDKLIAAGEEIIALIKRDDFKTLTQNAIPSQWNVKNETGNPHFLTFDYGLCKDENGEVTPMLIEMQGFPSLYNYQQNLYTKFKKQFPDFKTTTYANGIQAIIKDFNIK